jgi:hypothetical protein
MIIVLIHHQSLLRSQRVRGLCIVRPLSEINN